MKFQLASSAMRDTNLPTPSAMDSVPPNEKKKKVASYLSIKIGINFFGLGLVHSQLVL